MILRLRPVFLKAPLLAALLGTGLQLASPPAQAALFGDDEARQAVLNLRTKVDTLQRDLSRQLNDLASRQTDIEQRLGRLEVSQKASLSRQNDIDSLRQEVAQLRGQLEDTLNHGGLRASLCCPVGAGHCYGGEFRVPEQPEPSGKSGTYPSEHTAE